MASSSGGVPPGFRFHPTDEELLHYYLKKKVSFQKFDMEVIREVDLNKLEPWDLQEKCRIGSTPQNEWYFFSHKDRKYPTGSRTNRATNAGFWKATGRDKCIRNTFKKIGMRKTLVFYRGRAPHGQKTDWIMHEYRLEDQDQDHDPHLNSSSEDGWVVCRVFKKKNLFKVGGSNEGGGGGGSSTINSEITSTSNHNHNHNHYPHFNNTINTSSTNYNNMQGSSNQYYNMLRQQPPHHNLMNMQLQLQQQQQQAPTFELNNKPPHPHPQHDLALHYPLPHNHDHGLHPPYSLIPSSAYAAPDSNSLNMVKQLMITNAAARADCESGSDSGALHGYQPCEPGLEVGTSHQNISTTSTTTGRDHHHDQTDNHHQQASQAGMTEWTMLDRIVSPSAAANNDDALPNSVSVSAHINQLSLRATNAATAEMDFWGYAK